MLVRVYLEKGRVSATPESAETLLRNSKNFFFKTNKLHIFKPTPALELDFNCHYMTNMVLLFARYIQWIKHVPKNYPEHFLLI